MTHTTPPTPEQARAITDPRTRVHAANAAIDEHRQAIGELAQIARDTVAELRAAGASYGQIATQLGISRSRAQQLATPPPKAKGKGSG